MPIICPDGSKPRFRWKGNVRLAFCGNQVVEVKKEGGQAKKVKRKKRSKKGRKK